MKLLRKPDGSLDEDLMKSDYHSRMGHDLSVFQLQKLRERAEASIHGMEWYRSGEDGKPSPSRVLVTQEAQERGVKVYQAFKVVGVSQSPKNTYWRVLNNQFIS